MTGALCERRRAVTQRRWQGAEGVAPSTQHAEEYGAHSLVPGSQCVSARWSLHRRLFSKGVLKFPRCLKSSVQSQWGHSLDASHSFS